MDDASPRPLSAATTGSSTGSAYGAKIRTTTWQPSTSSGQPAAVADDVGRHGALDAEPDRGVGADPDGQGEQQQEQLGAAAAPVHEPAGGACSGRTASARHAATSMQSGGDRVVGGSGGDGLGRPGAPATPAFGVALGQARASLGAGWSTIRGLAERCRPGCRRRPVGWGSRAAPRW